MEHHGRSLVVRAAVLATLFLGAACGPRPPAELDTLVLRDSTYYDPGTLEPFSGRVVRRYPGADGRILLEGALEDGVWEGELTVYHESGRVRYQGRLSEGTPCGAWVENREDEPAGSVYSMLKQEIESMGLYPECPER